MHPEIERDEPIQNPYTYTDGGAAQVQAES